MATKSILTVSISICLFVTGIFGNPPRSNEISRRKSSGFKVYWNVPTFQCASHKISFVDVTRKFGIIQNENDAFRGNEIAIMYDPGYFPALLNQAGTKNFYFRNGGLPQQGNLTVHMEHFHKHVTEQIPDINFKGVGIIDFESWRPIFRQNFGTLTPYVDLSKDLERQMCPWWPNFLIEKEASRKFELFGKIFMEETLIYVKQLRPNATWGYYAYPYCYNMNSYKKKDCSSEVKKENDRLSWLFDSTDAFFPSLYMPKNLLTAKEKRQMIEGRIEEAKRIAKESNNIMRIPKILPYFWYRYRDIEEYLSKEDMYNSILTLKSLDIDGMIIWGSSSDVNTKTKCQNLINYVENTLGPILLST